MTGSLPYVHHSVMVREVLHFLDPMPGKIYCDATLGGGGHTEAILQATAPSGRVIGIDRDASAIQAAKARLHPYQDRFLAIQGTFGELPALLAYHGISQLDGLIADIGISSPQIDQPERGFSFQKPGPIDMRMNQAEGRSALDLIRLLSEEELANVLFHYGEEKFSRRIAKAIKLALAEGTLTDTFSLANVIARAIPTKDEAKDKATRSFQALRIAVNDELRQLDQLLQAASRLLVPGGRLGIISFHSLEDRIVKHALLSSKDPTSTQAFWEVLTKKPVLPSEEELAQNPRSRSARLRAAKRTLKGPL